MTVLYQNLCYFKIRVITRCVLKGLHCTSNKLSPLHGIGRYRFTFFWPKEAERQQIQF